MKIFQKGFNFSQDGPGNRLVYHMQGCNFACKWCSNPESIPIKNENAIEYSVNEILDESIRSRMMFFDGGGVTFTGGEPTIQFSELKEILKRLKENGINTTIETNGSSDCLAELFPYIDYLIMDFKHYDNQIHKKWIGGENLTTKRNLEEAFKLKRQLLIRIPLINGFNTEPDGFIEYFSRFDLSNAHIEVLLYHEYGKVKWQTPYTIENGFVKKADYANFKKKFKDNNIKIIET